MASSKRIAEVILKWDIDQASLRRVIDSNELIEKSLEDVKGATASVELTAKRLQYEFAQVSRIKSIDSLARDFAKVRIAGGDTVAEIERITKALVDMGATDSEIKRLVSEITNLGNVAEQAGNATSGGGTRISRGRLGQLGQSIFNLPDIPLGSGGFSSTDVSRLMMGADAVQQGIEKTGASFGTLAVTAALTAVAVAGVVLAFDNFNRTIAGVKTAVEGAIVASDSYYEAIRNATTKQVREQIASLERDTQVATLQLNELKQAKDDIFQQAQAGFTDAGARILEQFGLTSVEGLNDRIKELETQTQGASGAIVRLNEGLVLNAFAENDLAAAREEGIKTLTEIAQAERQREEAQIRRFLSFNQEIFGLERTATPETLTGRFQALDDERRALEQSLPFLQQRASLDEDANKTYQDTVQRLREISVEFIRLNNDVTPDALKRFNDELENTILKIESNRDARITQLQTDSQKKQQDILEDSNDKLLDIAERFNVNRVKAERDLQRELNKLERKRLDAIGNRGALEAYQIDQQKDEQKQAGEERESEFKEQYEREIKQLATQLNKRLATEREGLEKAIQLERQKAQAEIDQRRQAANVIINDLRNALDAETAIRRAASEAHIVGAATEAERIREIYASIQEGLPTATSGFNSGAIRTPIINADVLSFGSFGSGGVNNTEVTSTGSFGTSQTTPFDYSSLPPEFQYLIQNTASAPRDLITSPRSTPAPTAANTNGSLSFPININGIGMSRTQIINEVDVRLDVTLKKAGIRR